MIKQNVINHIALVLDASSSMLSLARDVIKVADDQIAHLARRSKEMDQETRITVYTFADRTKIQCLVYDKDVLRMPSIRDLYKPYGNTALVDATMKALDDLAKTPELYGDHAFLTYVITDGYDQHSANPGYRLEEKIKRLPENWTVAAFVPNVVSKNAAKDFGFPSSNIAIWDTTSEGFTEVGETIRRATDNYMTQRAAGVRGSKNLFNLDANVANLSKSELRAKAKKLAYQQYRVLDVADTCRIDECVESKLKRPYRVGEAYYQLSKVEKIQSDKGVAIRDRKTKELFVGEGARELVGLPSHEVKVGPAFSPDFDIFIQSTSVNRKLVPGTQVLIIN